MSHKAVFLFSGQGAQKVGMGRDLAESCAEAKALLEQADALFGESLSEVMFNGPEDRLTRTSYCQPALYVHGLMCLAALRERCPDLQASVAAGLSLGEFTAHAAAGTFAFADGFQLVAQRGKFMEQACEATEGSMAAMIGGDEDAARKLAEATGVDVANLNAPGQIVLSGPKEGIAKAIAGARDAGFRAGKELKVAGAYHSRLMQSAQDQLAAALAEVALESPAFPVISNFTAQPAADAETVRANLVAQVTGSVRWSESMTRLLDDGETSFIELGPGRVLAGLLNRVRKGTPCLSIEDLESLDAAAAELNGGA